MSKECGPFNKHQLIFYVIRGDILKLQEVFKQFSIFFFVSMEYLFTFDELYAVFIETCIVAIDNTARSTCCNRWHAPNALVRFFSCIAFENFTKSNQIFNFSALLLLNKASWSTTCELKLNHILRWSNYSRI